MDIGELYHFLFETYEGIGVLVGAGIVLSLLVSVIFEFRTRKLYRNHEIEDEDEWSLFEDVLEGEEEEDEAHAAKEAAAGKKTV